MKQSCPMNEGTHRAGVFNWQSPFHIWPQTEKRRVILALMTGQSLNDAKQWLMKRRSQRIELNIAVVVHRERNVGPEFSEKTQTLVASAHGALMALSERVTLSEKLLMQNINSGEQQECHVVYVNKERTGPIKVAVEFTRPAPSFWRIAYPPADWTPNI